MLYPSIDELLKIIDSKYSLVTIAAKRARELQEHHNEVLEKYVSDKNVGKALEEIYVGALRIKQDEPAS
ncbi:DNA-directed RNA polymerase subunit omega [Weizmannia acidilactici]|nr:DNA-directed RNA polymerase subunit omega [Weizmannia acidilactici]